MVNVAIWDDWIEEYEEDVRIIDFGEAFMHGQEPEKLAQPSALRIPELFSKTLWTTDWTCGVLALW